MPPECLKCLPRYLPIGGLVTGARVLVPIHCRAGIEGDKTRREGERKGERGRDRRWVWRDGGGERTRTEDVDMNATR